MSDQNLVTAIVFEHQVIQLDGLAEIFNMERDALLGQLIEAEYERVALKCDGLSRRLVKLAGGSTDE